jgi:O-antigen/teichoic acid export membrane protein
VSVLNPSPRAAAAAGATRRRLEAVANRDAALLSIGTVASGVLAYVFNVLAARTLGPEEYGPIAILWVLLFLLAVLLFRPLEQTMARAVADGLARGHDGRHAARLIGRLGATVAAVAAIACLAAWGPLTDGLFAGHGALTAALAAGLLGYGASYMVRGLVGGVRWFGGYGLVLLWDGGVRVLLGLALLATASPAVAGAALVGAAFGGALAPLFAKDRARLGAIRGESGAEFDLAGAARFAVPAAVVALCEQVIVSGGPLLVLLEGGSEATTAAGVVFAATLLVRAPVFLFQGVAASLLPSLTTFHSRGDHAQVHRATLLVAGAIGVFAVTMAAAALVAGPQVMRLLYGHGFSAARGDLALLALGVGCFLAASTFSQAVLAQARAGCAAAAWSLGAVAFVAIDLLAPGTPFHGVALAFAGASGVVAALVFADVWRSRA